MKILKYICSIFLSIILILLITTFIGVTVLKQSLHLQSTPSFFFIEKVQALEVEDVNITNINSITPELIHEYMDETLEEKGIPKEALDYVLQEGDYKKILLDYQNDYIQYLAGNKEIPKLPIDKIYEMIDKGIAKYNKETNSNIDVSYVREEINQASLTLEDSLVEVGENSFVKTVFKILGNNKLNIIFILSIGVIIISLLVLNGIASGMIYVAVSSILSGIVSIIISQLLNISNLETLKSMLGSFYSNVSASFLAYGFITIMIGIILFVIPIMIKIKNKGSKIND